MPNFQSFFKSKTLLVLIPVLILVLLTLGYFFVSNNSQKAQKTSSQSSISSSSPANSISQNPSQGNSTSSNSQSSIFPNSTQNVNSTSSQLSNSKSEISKPEQLFFQNNQIQPLIADSEHDVVVLPECDLAVRFKKSTYQKPKLEKKNTILDNNLPFVAYDFATNKDTEYGGGESLRIDCTQYKTTTDFTNKQLDFNKVCTFPEDETFQKKLEFYKDKLPCGDLPNLYNFKILTEASHNQIYFISFYPKNKRVFSFFNFKNNIDYLIAIPWQGVSTLDQSKIVEDLDNTDKLQFQFNSLAPSVPSVKLENSVQAANSVSIPQKTLQKCDDLECFTGTIGTQPVILKKVKDEGAGMGSSYYSGIITYTKAGNTPIPIKWRQANSVDCGLEGIYLCRDITIDEDIPSGGTLRQLIKYNKNTKQEEKSQWTWTSKDGKTVLPVTLTQVDKL